MTKVQGWLAIVILCLIAMEETWHDKGAWIVAAAVYCFGWAMVWIEAFNLRDRGKW